MLSFKYQVRATDGRLQSGMVEAASQEDATNALLERDMQVLSLQPYRGAEASVQALTRWLNRITSKDLVAGIRMLSVMVSASVPITDSVRNISKQSKNPYFKFILQDIANEIEGGARFSDALDRYPKVFSQFFINMVRSGETTGQLAEVLNYLADQQEKDYEMMSKLRGAMIYPAVILSSMTIAGFVMMVYVVPKMTEVLTESNVELPLSTKILIGTSSVMSNYWWLIILGVAAFATAFAYWIKTDYGRLLWDGAKLKIPIVGKLLREMYITRFCQAMSTLMKGGVTMVQALEIASAVMGNAVWKKLVLETIQEVNDGNSMVTALQRDKSVPLMAVQMLSVGEETGKLEEVLHRVGDFYSRSVANMTANMMTLIEPLIMIALGLAVGVMVSAIMIPMYNLSSAV
ncbi:MAG: type II secretion system F family protein [Patescibacteria group bacterium]|nr:type II secretion system F family protein [Patescibacteria group bacterium]